MRQHGLKTIAAEIMHIKATETTNDIDHLLNWGLVNLGLGGAFMQAQAVSTKTQNGRLLTNTLFTRLKNKHGCYAFLLDCYEYAPSSIYARICGHPHLESMISAFTTTFSLDLLLPYAAISRTETGHVPPNHVLSEIWTDLCEKTFDF